MEDEYEIIDFFWGNPLQLQEYKISRGLAEEMNNLFSIVNAANKLAKTCNCDTCKRIAEITWQPIFG